MKRGPFQSVSQYVNRAGGSGGRSFRISSRSHCSGRPLRRRRRQSRFSDALLWRSQPTPAVLPLLSLVRPFRPLSSRRRGGRTEEELPYNLSLSASLDVTSHCVENHRYLVPLTQKRKEHRYVTARASRAKTQWSHKQRGAALTTTRVPSREARGY